MKDRVPKYPGRVKMTPVPGQPGVYDMERADEPTEPGTPLNKASLLSSETAAVYGLGEDATPDDALREIWEQDGKIRNGNGDVMPFLPLASFIQQEATTYVKSTSSSTWYNSGVTFSLDRKRFYCIKGNNASNLAVYSYDITDPKLPVKKAAVDDIANGTIAGVCDNDTLVVFAYDNGNDAIRIFDIKNDALDLVLSKTETMTYVPLGYDFFKFHDDDVLMFLTYNKSAYTGKLWAYDKATKRLRSSTIPNIWTSENYSQQYPLGDKILVVSYNPSASTVYTQPSRLQMYDKNFSLLYEKDIGNNANNFAVDKEGRRIFLTTNVTGAEYGYALLTLSLDDLSEISRVSLSGNSGHNLIYTDRLYASNGLLDEVTGEHEALGVLYVATKWNFSTNYGITPTMGDVSRVNALSLIPGIFMPAANKSDYVLSGTKVEWGGVAT